MSETSDVVTPTIKALNGIPGVRCFRLHSGTAKVRGGFMRNNTSGTPDLVAIVLGKAVFFEAKSATGVLSGIQAQEAAMIGLCGCPVFCIRSVREAIDVIRDILAVKG